VAEVDARPAQQEASAAEFHPEQEALVAEEFRPQREASVVEELPALAAVEEAEASEVVDPAPQASRYSDSLFRQPLFLSFLS
jgi:hypothetical protein